VTRPRTIVTEDGYVLRLDPDTGTWDDGDLAFPSDADGNPLVGVDYREIDTTAGQPGRGTPS
jgi:hypothetical protein